MAVTPNYQNRVLLCLLLIVLNVVIRIPSVPHEIGGDTYQLHAIANSISQFGEARWWVNWLSVIGMYSYSYASAVPFCLSGISQITGTDVEITVYLYALSIGLLSAGTAYIMAGAFYNEYLFKYLTSLFYSISSGVLTFTSWNASARGLFLVIFPLFIFVLLKELPSLWKKLLLVVLVLIFLRSTHNFSYFTIPLIVVFFSIEVMTKANLSIEKMNLNRYQNYLYLFITCVLFIIPFITKLFIVGSKYQAVIDLLETTTRYIGPIVIFVIPGYLYLALKNNRTKYENFILFSTLFFIPISYSETYGKFITLPLSIFYITVAIRNTLINKKNIALFVVIIIISFSCFSSFYSHFRTGSSNNYFYMSEECSVAGIWTKNNMEENTRVYTTGAEIWRMLAVSDGYINFPTIPVLALIYGFVDDVNNSTIQTSPYSTSYYFDGPYIQKSGTSKWGEFTWYEDFDVNDGRIKKFVQKYNLDYVISDVYAGSNTLINSLQYEKSLIYNNGRIQIWDL